MDYELIISERADELTKRLVAYLLNNLNNPGAAARFLDEAAICDVNLIRIINTLSNEATKEEYGIEREDAETKIVESGII